MRRDELDLSIVLACYNEEDILEGSLEEIVAAMDDTRFSYEIIFVDDCSRDGTRELIDQLMKRWDHVPMKKIFHQENTGRGRAVTDGFLKAGGDIVGYLDVDLEVHPRYIPSMVRALRSGADLVTAYRVYKVKMSALSLLRNHILSRGYRILSRMALGHPFRDTETGFKFFRREMLLPLLAHAEHPGWFWDTEIMILAHRFGLRVVEIPCLYIRRTDKESSVRVARDVWAYLKALWHMRRKMKRLG